MINTAFCFKISVSLLVYYLTKEMDVYHSNQRFLNVLYRRPEIWTLCIISPDYGWVMMYTKEKLHVALYG